MYDHIPNAIHISFMYPLSPLLFLLDNFLSSLLSPHYSPLKLESRDGRSEEGGGQQEEKGRLVRKLEISNCLLRVVCLQSFSSCSPQSSKL